MLLPSLPENLKHEMLLRTEILEIHAIGMLTRQEVEVLLEQSLEPNNHLKVAKYIERILDINNQ